MLRTYSNYFKAFIGTHIKDERGQGLVEYALLVVGIAGIILAAVAFLDLDGIFTEVSNNVKDEIP